MKHFENPYKLLAVLVILIGLWGTVAILKTKPTESAQPEKRDMTARLIQGKEPDHPTEGCLPPQAVFKEELVKYEQYTLVSHYMDDSAPLSDDLLDFERQADHDQTYPNIDVAIMVIDPTEGCKSTIKSMRAEPLPQSWPQPDRVKLKKVYWALVLTHVEEQNVLAQSWLDDQTNHVEFGFADDDIKAVTSLGLSAPKWYDKSKNVDFPDDLRNSDHGENKRR